MLLVAPFLWVLSLGGPTVPAALSLGLLVAAWVAGVSGSGVLIYGVVAKSALQKTPPGTPPSPHLPRYCPNCATENPLEAENCVSCGIQLPAG